MTSGSPRFDRIIWIVLDSVGIGELPDARDYGDVGRDTLGHIARSRTLRIPNLQRLGIGNIAPLESIAPPEHPAASYGKGATKSPGKDTTTGHWEMAGVWLDQAFPVYPNGFPKYIISEFERQIGRRTLGNKPASGTEIIKELGLEHVTTGFPIVYTSGDSVFQVAAHEDVIPIEELYRMCEIARKILDGPNRVGRVIARPFAGPPSNFQRTERRHDYAVEPPKPMLMDVLAERGGAGMCHLCVLEQLPRRSHCGLAEFSFGGRRSSYGARGGFRGLANFSFGGHRSSYWFIGDGSANPALA